MAKDQRQGWALFGAMAFLFFAGVTVAYRAEAGGNPIVNALGVDPGLGNMEGKEVRFGVANSALYATVTTDASCGAITPGTTASPRSGASCPSSTSRWASWCSGAWEPGSTRC